MRHSDPPALVLTAWIAIADVPTVLALPIVLSTCAVMRVASGGVSVALAGVALYTPLKSKRQ